MTLPAFWLVVVYCITPGDCVDRLYPDPLPGSIICMAKAAELIRAQRETGVIKVRSCTQRKPVDVPVLRLLGSERFA